MSDQQITTAVTYYLSLVAYSQPSNFAHQDPNTKLPPQQMMQQMPQQMMQPPPY